MNAAKRAGLVGAALTAALVSVPAAAVVDWSLNGSTGYDSNPGRLSAGSSGSATLFGGGTLTVDEHRPRLDATAGANLGYQEYLSGGYKGQLVGSVVGSLRYALIPKTLFWSIDDTFGQGTSNALAAATPSNRTNVNVFSTGPTLILPLNSVTRLQADARYGRDTYANGYQPNDDRYTGSLGLIRQLSTLSSLGLNLDYAKVRYSSRNGNLATPGLPGNLYEAADYDRQSAFARYTTGDKRNTLSLDAGASKVSQSGQTFNSPLVRLNLTHRVSSYWSIAASGGREFTDGAQNFASSVSRSGVPLPNTPPAGVTQTTQTLPLTNQPLRTDSGTASATYQATRTTISVGAGLAHDRFLITTRSDDNRTNANVSFSRRLSPFTDLHLGASYEYRDFLNIGVSDRTTYANATYSWQIDPAFRLYTSYNYEKRNSSTHVYSYTDNRIVLGVTYTPQHRSRPASTSGAPAMPR
jgi:Putative beta-barrel porin 2